VSAGFPNQQPVGDGHTSEARPPYLTVPRYEQRRALRWRYLQEQWSSRICAVPGCEEEIFQLHHSTYGQPLATELWAVLPLCGEHHKLFEFEIWPVVRHIMPRYLATQNWIVHGEPLLEWEDWWRPILIPQVHPDQLALWEVGP
jgi:hypothetical protein